MTDVGSWREGGGRAAPQQPSPERGDASQNGSATSGGASGGTSQQQQPPQPGMRPTGQGQQFGIGPGGRPMMPQYRGMMPPAYVSVYSTCVCVCANVIQHILYSLSCIPSYSVAFNFGICSNSKFIYWIDMWKFLEWLVELFFEKYCFPKKKIRMFLLIIFSFLYEPCT